MREDEMTPEERYERMDRTIQFILNVQAQFYADVRKAEEEIRQNNAMIARLGEHISQVNNNLTRELAQRDAEWREQMVEWRQESRERIEELTEKLADKLGQKLDRFLDRLDARSRPN